MTRVDDEIIDFIAGGCTSADVADFSPSEEAKQRVAYLLGRLKDEALTPDETSELDRYVQLEYIMSLAKARARQHLGR